MQNVVERVLNLLIYLLESPTPVTSNDVRNTIPGYADQSDDAFHRMFERDKQVLRRLGVPLEFGPGETWEMEDGYIVDPERYAIPDPGLNGAERLALSVAARAVRLGGTEPGVGAIMKLGVLEGAGGFEPLGADLGEGAETLGELFSAIAERRRVQFSYRDQSRVVEPYGIAHRRGHWYLVGNTDEGERMYRVDRMQDVEVQERPDAFKRPKGFDIRKSVDSQPWETGFDDPVQTEVRFDPDVAWWAARSLGLPEPEGELVTMMSVVNRDAFIGWILSFGDSAEVIGPPEMRAAVSGRVSEAIGQLP